MKRLVAALLGTFGVASSPLAGEPELGWFAAKGDAFSIQAPKTWRKNEKAEFLSVQSPDGAVAITASAYGKQGGSLREFADFRFSSVQDFYKQVGPEHQLSAGVYREYEGVWPGEKAPTYYVVGAGELGSSAYVSVTIVTSRSDFQKNRALYIRVLQSSKLGL